MQTDGRLTAWQNWIFNRPNAVGEDGALQDTELTTGNTTWNGSKTLKLISE